MNQQVESNQQNAEQSSDSSLWSDELLEVWLRRDPKAVPLDQWIHWNNSPLRHASKEVITSFFPTSFSPLFCQDARTSTHVDALLRSRLSWNSAVAWAPQDPLWEVSMITPPRFQRLAFLGAAFSLQPEIAKTIDGTMVRQLRKQLGEDIFQFVLLSGLSSKYFLEPLNRELSAVNDLSMALQQGAITIMQHAFSSKERGIQERIASKLSGCFSNGYCDAPLAWSSPAEKMISTLWKETASWL